MYVSLHFDRESEHSSAGLTPEFCAIIYNAVKQNGSILTKLAVR